MAWQAPATWRSGAPPGKLRVKPGEFSAPKPSFQATGAPDGPSLEQPLPSITTAGRNPTLTCLMKGSKTSDHVVYWYRQKQDRQIQFLVSYREKSRPVYGKGITERFIPEVEESSNAFQLTIGNAEISDEGVYYCAVWLTNQYVFGGGTEIRVQGTEDTHRPHLSLFGPSLKEIQFHNSATILCHTANFSPSALRVKWHLNQISIPHGTFTFPVIKNSDNTFEQTAGITIPAKLWKQGAEIMCVSEHETGVQNVSARTSTEEPSIHVQEDEPSFPLHAFITYAALLAINGTYGFALFLCLIKRKLNQRQSKRL
ncbi:immunoglobulin kappa light chain-like [Spea bombifrons]|uniref:immunoglobulin kappa light chain-like n=1 Tax=Spea bombifrons TaxID=233779 RepID=UPI00234BEF53|nr:immunoglobulin kappa light chain-like [Spea bombifrons]